MSDKEKISSERVGQFAQSKVSYDGKATSLANKGHEYRTKYSPRHCNIVENKENNNPAGFEESQREKVFSDAYSLPQKKEVTTMRDATGSGSSRLSYNRKIDNVQQENLHRANKDAYLSSKVLPRSQEGTSSSTQVTESNARTLEANKQSLTVKKNSVVSEKNTSAKLIEQQKNNEQDIPTTIVCNLANVYRKFTRGKMLGKGGFAKCYLATESLHVQIDPKNQTKQNRDDKKFFLTKDSKGKEILVEKKTRYFALKIVSKQSVAKSKARTKQLQTEIRVHRGLSHQHIVRFESCFTDDLNTYILLELCHNHSMAELLRRRKYLTEFEVKYYVLQLVDALTYLYKAKVIHRDLKLGNLFLDRQMRIKVGDFGLSASLPGYSVDDRRNTVCGTPNYIAPEILAAKGHSFEVDMWSLGVIIYTLLIGKPPYESKDVKATYKRILNNDYSFPMPSQTKENEDIDQDHNILKRESDSTSNSKRLKYKPPQVPSLAQNLIGSMLQLSPKNRPLPENVELHPYLFDNRQIIPATLPTTATQIPPHELIAEYERRYKHVESSEVSERLNHYMELINFNPKWKDEDCKMKQKNHQSHPTNAHFKQENKENRDMKAMESRVPRETFSSSDYTKKEQFHSNNEVENVKMTKVGLPVEEMRSVSKAQVRASKMRDADRVQVATESLTKKMEACSLSEKILESPESLSLNSRSSRMSTVKTRTTKGKLSDVSHKHITEGRSVSSVKELTPRMSSSTKADPKQKEKYPIKSKNRGQCGAYAYPSVAPLKTDNLDPGKYAPSKSKLIDRYDVKNAEDVSLTSDKVGSTIESYEMTRSSSIWSEKKETNESLPMNNAGKSNRPPSMQTQHSEEKKKVTPRNKEKGLKDGESKGAPNTVEVMHAKLTKRLTTADKKSNDTPTSANSLSSASLTTSFSPKIDLKQREELDDRYSPTFIDKKNMETPQMSRVSPYSSSPLVPLTVPKTWVCRYADYTSKYGLGFLMNNGSAGVLFNDATKIVVCPHNKVVRYIERMSASNNVANEHTFLLESYPPHLHKKTTLLIHFRDFLIKDSNFANIDNMTCDCKFSEKVDAKGPEGKIENNSKYSADLVYVKKWIRTEQALLFRLSNRSVQLLFSDKTELLLSSEARIVTYLDENNKRETFHLSSIMADEERGDVVKKLKYTKDVLHLLVHGKDNSMNSKTKPSASSTHKN